MQNFRAPHLRFLFAFISAIVFFNNFADASSRVVTAGQAVTFSVAVQGTAPFTYQWRKNGAAISNATSASYSINSATTADTAAYSVAIANPYGSTTSDDATLTVTSAVVAPSITTQPASLTVTTGQSASFSVAAAGSAPLTYRWRKNGTTISGATSATYSIASTNSASAGAYSVVVSNAAGSVTSASATLTISAAVVAPSITTQPASLTVTTGQSASFSVAAAGSAPLTYRWRKNGTTISGATSATYSISSTNSASAGAYSVVVSNSAGSVTSASATLAINAASSLVELVPESSSARGQFAPVEGLAQLFDGQVLTKWLDFSATTWVQINLATAASLQAYTITSANDFPVRDPASWTLSGSNDGVTWIVIETRTAQSWSSRFLPRDFVLAAPSAAYRRFRFDFRATSGTITQLAELELFGSGVVAPPPPAAPAITTQPVARTVNAGQSASFSVAASGPTLAYQWRKNGTAISGATSATYSIASATSAHAGTYSVVVSNSAGSVTSASATLTVNAAVVAPTITTQPVARTVNAGQSASFSVAATGSAPLAYQWRKNGTAISGATSATYSIASATAAHAGTYSVVVSNSAGSVTSASATLTVTPASTLVDLIPQSFSARGQFAPVEGIAQLFDGRTSTKWLDFSANSWVQVTLATPKVLQAYSLTSANDFPGRDPASWTLYGSNDGVTWTVIETRSGQSWGSRFLARDFVLAAPSAAYSRFRFNFQATSGSITQLAELELYGHAASTPSIVELTPQSFSARGQFAPVEGIAQLFDGQTSTKWLDFSASSWVQVTLAAPKTLQAYSLTSANDVPARDPASWTLSGSNDGVTWTVIETRSGQSWSSRFLTRDFIVLAAPSAAYSRFRFNFQATSGSITQLAELELYGSP